MDAVQAAQEYEIALKTLSADRINGNEVLIPIEKFVVSFEEQSHAEQTMPRYKDSKKPEDFSRFKALMGTDHVAFKDLARVMGMGEQVDHHTGNNFSRSTMPTDPERLRLL